MSEWHLQNTDNLTRNEQTTVVAALVHYSLAMADPTVACFALDKLAPRTDGEDWYPYIDDARSKLRVAPVPQSLRA